MTLPLSDILRQILAPPPAATSAPAGTRLDALFAALQAPVPPRPVHELEDEIWAVWTSHPDAVLETRMHGAIAAIAARRHDDAALLLDALVRDAPDWAEAWNKRATLRYLTLRDADSLQDICRTLTLERRHFGAICGFAQICLRHGEIAAAASAFGAALALHPHLESVRLTLAELEPERPHRLN